MEKEIEHDVPSKIKQVFSIKKILCFIFYALGIAILITLCISLLFQFRDGISFSRHLCTKQMPLFPVSSLENLRSSILHILNFEGVCKTSEMLGLISILIVQVFKHIGDKELGIERRYLIKQDQPLYIMHISVYAISIIGCIWSAYNNHLELTLLWIMAICFELCIHAKVYIHIILNKTTCRRIANKYLDSQITSISKKCISEKTKSEALFNIQGILISQIDNEHLLDSELYYLLARNFVNMANCSATMLPSFITMWTNILQNKSDESCYIVLSHLLPEIFKKHSEEHELSIDCVSKILGAYYCWIRYSTAQKNLKKELADEYHLKCIQNIYNILSQSNDCHLALLLFFIIVNTCSNCDILAGREDPNEVYYYLIDTLKKIPNEKYSYNDINNSHICESIIKQMYGEEIAKEYYDIALKLTFAYKR